MLNGKRLTDATRPARATTRARRWSWLALVVLFSASGASCPGVLHQYTQPVPRALPQAASLQQIVTVVNDNSARVQSVSTTKATISTPGYPSLSGNIAFQRPRSFRLVAQKFVGPEVDMGSNEEQFWFWIKREQPPAMFFCRHDQFATSAARQIIPVEPEWLIEAMGVVTIDPASQPEGPFAVGNGRVEIKSKVPSLGGMASRVTIIDETRGIVLEEHLYDPQGVRLASALLSKHVRDPASGVTLPRRVEIKWPPTQRELTIDMSDVQINQLTPAPDLFARPHYEGYNTIDLAQPNGQLPPAGTPGQPGMYPPGTQYPPGVAYPAGAPTQPAAAGPYRAPASARY